MNRRRALTILGATGAVLACGGFDWPFTTKPRRTSLLIAGATSMHPVIEKLAAAFAADNNLIDTVVEGGGSTPGLIAVQRGAIDIAALTRQPTRFEETNGTRAFLIAKDAIAVAAHPSVPLKSLSLGAARQIFQGQARRWSDVGGPDLPVRLVLRSDEDSIEQSAAMQMLLELQDVPDQAVQAGDAREVLHILRRDPGAVGFLALKDMAEDLNVFEIGRVAPARLTVISGRYPLTRPYYFVTHGPLKQQVSDFLDFARGAEGQGILEREGLIRVH
jgi:phosphate transport system substrate-binding protein